MQQTEKLLKDYTDEEKGAYLGAIASIATADHSATEEETEYIGELADAAELSAAQKQAVIAAATELSGDELKNCLDILKTSELRFSLITDLISFAESDQHYSAEEKNNVEKIAQYLNIDQQQFSLLDQFAKKTAASGASGEEVSKPGFLSSLGLQEKFQSAGINMGGLTKGLLGIAGPMILAKLLSGGMRGGRGMNPFGSSRRSSGGFGSLISMLNGGRGFGSAGGLLSSIFGR
ncbi:MAG: TerB family tellurite resistance protein [Chitinophagaceae bacterium]